MNKSSSKSSQATTTQNYDQRIVADGGSLAFSGASGNSVVLTDYESTKSAFDFANVLAQSGEKSFDKLLDTATGLFEGAASAVSRAQDQTAEAYKQAIETRQGTIDNKTITVIAVAGAAAMILKGRK